jgi:hypothetical protein
MFSLSGDDENHKFLDSYGDGLGCEDRSITIREVFHG